jgi:peroxiredoxin
MLAASSIAVVGFTSEEAEAGAAMDFSLRDLNNVSHTLSQYKGKVVVMSFWATWCGPCQVEMPHLQAMYTELGPQGLVILGISTDDARTSSQVRTIVNAKKVTYPILLDTDTAVVARYNPAKTLPYTVTVDRAGAVADQHAGYNAGDEVKLKELVVGLLAKPAQ